MPIIAIDGQSATGKSTAARAVAAQLQGFCIDTGEMLRDATLKALELGLDPAQASSIIKYLKVDPQERRSPAQLYIIEVERAVPIFAGTLVAQNALTSLLRNHVNSTSLYIISGRTIGLDVFPDAMLKINLRAELETRAARKASQLGIGKAQALNLISGRDHLDRTRQTNPLRRDHRAIEIDTTARPPAHIALAIIDSYKRTVEENNHN
jgi:cytidylate kinase